MKQEEQKKKEQEQKGQISKELKKEKEQQVKAQQESELKKRQRQTKAAQTKEIEPADEESKPKSKETIDDKYVKGVVKFSNISVRNIPKMDLIGKSDPYVVFEIGTDSQQTTVAKESLDYDYLNEEYQIAIDPQSKVSNGQVSVSVFDYDSFSKNDLVGTVNVDV
ncbi:MAG: hypothetical protein EZS28_049331 [Streblomastix strix]|uniref:C2 domain-containing protein n=1 Tax=Streblomastix strix TaxID=222440 RepID=A0A5J4TB44_9EUKA|nr:MAG: hypothetical protein EZS28_049331 [Streblomastix strix]